MKQDRQVSPVGVEEMMKESMEDEMDDISMKLMEEEVEQYMLKLMQQEVEVEVEEAIDGHPSLQLTKCMH